MVYFRAPTWRAYIMALMTIATCLGLSFNATNSTSLPGPNINLTVYLEDQYNSKYIYFVVPLTNTANLTGNQSISGPSYFASTTNQNFANSSNIVFISCDSNNYPGILQAQDVYNNVINRDSPPSIVLYSQTASWCQAVGDLGTEPVFSVSSPSPVHFGWPSTDLPVVLGSDMKDFTSSSGNNATNSNSSNTSSAPTGTTLTMIILYSVTGVITALFMFIVVAGALKARRHIDRYGRQVVGGRVQQTRAVGLAMAMLDTIPIVKFGHREPPKTVDVELGHAITTQPIDTTKQPQMSEKAVEAAATTVEGGIAAASNTAVESDNSLGCSICTDDFELGQDQRVLPCDHRFHPACVDPWLLNVSATCPLCRVDLRPPEDEDEQPEPEEHITQPIVSRAARRRSVLAAITGFRRPDGMTREERIEALRQYRRNNSTTVAGAERLEGAQSNPEHMQHQLRRLFNIRTWRTSRARPNDAG